MILFSLCLAGLGALMGCQKDPYVNTVQSTPYLGLPQGQQSVMNVDLARLRSKEFFRQIMDSMKASGEYEQIFGELNRSLGSDPMQEIDRVVIGERGAPAPGDFPLKNTVFIATGRFDDPATRMRGLHQWLQSELLIAPPPFQETLHAGTDYKVYSLQAKSMENERMMVSLNFGFPTPHLMVVAFSPAMLAETLDVMAGSAEGIRQEPAWLEMLQRPNLGSVIWGTGNIKPDFRRMGSMVFPGVPFAAVQQYYFSLDPNEEFSCELGLVCNAIDAAQQIATGIKAGISAAQQHLISMKAPLPETYQLPEKVVVLPQGNIVKVSLALNQQTTTRLRLEWRGFHEQQRKLNEAQSQR